MPIPDPVLRAIDERFVRHRELRRAPGFAWGLLLDGALVHAAGDGTARVGEDRLPGPDTVFRIASMTKSFTAAAILLLRDEGRLRLDDPVAVHVPELAGWTPPTADSPPVTVRQLLAMSAGLPTDDPWGDRQQALPLDAFARLLAAGPSFGWPPGTAFDYSNLGYGILGRVVTAAAGAEYRDVVRDRLLLPLGMASSGFGEEDVPADALAHGYVRRGEAFVREGTDAYGALASMGGVYSTVRDLARWVAGFLDAFPARNDPEGPHPLRRASRREMQQVQRAFPIELEAVAPDVAPSVVAGGYGFGLFIRQDPELGVVVSHSGGYPGYGSNMQWHPASGAGVVSLGNVRYAWTSPPADEALRQLVLEGHARRRTLRPMPSVERLAAVAEALLARWDDAVADATFAANMDLDEPRAERRAALEQVAADLGPFRRDESRRVVATTPAERAWWLRGERGWVRLAVLVSPEPEPRIQDLRATPVRDPSPALVAAADAVLGAAAGASLGAASAPGWLAWPAALSRGGALEDPAAVAAVERSLRAAAARFGRLSRGMPTAGDGAAGATWDLVAERGGGATLRIALDPATGAVTAAELRTAAVEAPPEAW